MRGPLLLLASALAVLAASAPEPAGADPRVAGAGPAATPGAEVLRVPVGEGAVARNLPATRDGLAEFLVRRTPADLRARLDGRRAPGVKWLDVGRWSNDGWLVRAALDPGVAGLRAEVEAGVLVVRAVGPQEVAALERVEAPSLEALLSGEARVDGPPDALPSPAFLWGDALARRIDADRYRPVLLHSPNWLPGATWRSAEEAHRALVSAPEGPERDAQALRYALLLLDLGLEREAWYVLGWIRGAPPGAELDLEIARLRAALGTGRWAEARAALHRALALGLDEAGAAEALALLALATGEPDRVSAARLLAAQSSEPRSLALAAELLQREGRFRESLPLLEAAVADPATGRDPRACLRLGDALLVAGRRDDAARAWRCAPPELAAVRRIQLRLVEGDAASWPRQVPELARRARPRSEAGAEALYLLAQVDAVVGAPWDALTELSTFMRRFPRRAEASDVPERFWALYADTVETYDRAERDFRIAALHESTWNRIVLRAVDRPEVLERVARAYERVGLGDRAVRVLRQAVARASELGRSDVAAVRQLATLYARQEDWRDGLDAVRWLRERDPEGEAGALDLLEARFLRMAGDEAGAARALRRAARREGWRDRASLELALMDAEAGRCRVALPALERLLPRADIRDSAPYLALARCLAAAGRAEEAAAAARRAAGLSASEEESRYALWLASAADGWTNERLVDALESGDDIWAAMAREQREARRFEEELVRFVRGR